MGGTRGFTRFAPLGAAIVLSLVVFFTPASGVPTAPPGTDKVIHLMVFALLAATGRWAGMRTGPLLAGLTLYAGASEVLQALLPIGRDGDILDALTDLAGALLGLTAFHLVHRTRRTTTPRTR